MAQFSIRQAVRFSFFAYAKHWMVLLAAGIIFGASVWMFQMVPRMAAQRMGITQEMVMDQSDGQQPVMDKVNRITQKISAHLENVPKHSLFLLFLLLIALWIVHLFFLCGFIRIALRVKDKDAASLRLFLDDKGVVLPVIGVLIIVYLYAICMLIGISVLSIPTVIIFKHLLGAGVLRFMMGMTGLVVVFLAFTFWFVGYVFPVITMVDKPKIGVRAALAMSRSLVSGIRFKMIGAFIVIGVILGICGLILHNVLMIVGVYDMPLRQAIVVALLMPIGTLFLVNIYRALNGK